MHVYNDKKQFGLSPKKKNTKKNKTTHNSEKTTLLEKILQLYFIMCSPYNTYFSVN